MKNRKIPTTIGILILLILLPLVVVLVKQKQMFRLSAEGDYPPQNVKITNVTSSSFSVIWTTSQPTTAFILWGESENSLNQTSSDEIGGKSFVHSSTISGLSPNKKYYFKINSGGKIYENGQKAWEIKTAPPKDTNPSASNNIKMGGKVITASGNEAANTLIIVNIEGAQTLSTTTSQNGNWIMNIDSVLNTSLTEYIQPSRDDKASVIAQAGAQGISTAELYLRSGLNIPPMILGQNHDFTNLPNIQETSVPNSEIETPQQTIKKPKFDTQGSPIVNKEVSIDSIEEGETIYTNRPEFFGQAPPQSSITIRVESESPISETLNTSSSGSWRWSPPSPLSPGKHKVIITYRDENGILRSIVRNFIVQAAETDEPAFESTPSATLTPTPQTSPTTIPTSTPPVQNTASPSATPAQPVSGVTTPTLILLSIGILLFTASGFLLFAN